METDSPITVILGAMDAEISAVLDEMQNRSVSHWKAWEFHFGTVEGRNVVLCKSGVGKVFAAMVMQHLIDNLNVEQVLFTGVAGAIATDLEPGDLLIARDLVHHDMDVTGLGFEVGQIPFTSYRFFEGSQCLLDGALKISLEEGKLRCGRIGTGDQFITDKARIPKELALDAVDMEGCSVAQVCRVNEVDFLIMRIISDRADEGATSDFFENLPKYAQRSLDVIRGLLRSGNQ